MTGQEAIFCIAKQPICVGCQEIRHSFQGCNKSNYYIQYSPRLPSDCRESIHYEFIANEKALMFRLDIEGKTVCRDAVRARLGLQGTHRNLKIATIDLNGLTEEGVRKFAESNMQAALAQYEDNLKALEEEYRQTRKIQAVVGRQLAPSRNSAPVAKVVEGMSTTDAGKESADSRKLMLMNNGADPAMMSFDCEKWTQSDYEGDVRELSELGSGVFSWVSTVEELAKKSAICVKGVSVKPAKFRIPPYQRKFAWREHDVRQLCRDLLKTDNKVRYHLGTIILHYQRMDDGREIWNVVDGQQRLTNIMVMLRAPIFELPIKQFLARDYEMICQVLADYSGEEQAKIRNCLSRCTLAFISVENITEAFQLFTTQNGRGKPLTPVNLLKAYHYKEMDLDRQEMTEEGFDKLLKETEQSWESANVASMPSAPGDGKLLLHVFREYLFRLRLWSRGKFSQVPFNARDIGEFKGVSIKTGEQGLPLQNGAVLRRNVDDDGPYVAHRRTDDTMSPYVSICQTIVNGADFFTYVHSYVDAYKDVFCEGVVKEFHDFYMKNSDPRRDRSGAAMYARHVFEALCLFCYDRFGAAGLLKCFSALYACAYYERVSQTRVLYRKCGAMYAPKAIEAMMTTFSAEDAQLALNELRTEVRLALRSSSYLKSLLKKDNPTKGEARQLAAYLTIAG